MSDYYQNRVEEVLNEVIELYNEVVTALHQVNPELIEALSQRRMELLGHLRELSAEDYFGRSHEPWFVQLSERVREAEAMFEQALQENFEKQRAQMNKMGQNRRARRAYGSAA